MILFSNSVLGGEWGGGGRGNGPGFRPLQSYAPQLFHQKASYTNIKIKIIKSKKVREKNNAGSFGYISESELIFSNNSF